MKAPSDLATRARKYIACSVAVLMLSLFGIYATFEHAPRYLEIVTSKTRSDKVTVSRNGGPEEQLSAERHSTYTSHALKIENLGSKNKDAWISLTAAYLDNNIPVELGSFQNATGDWGIDPHLQRFTSSKIGSTANWKGFGAGISLAITSSTPDVKLRVRWNGETKLIQIKEPNTWKVIKLPSHYSSLYLPLSANDSIVTVVEPKGRIYLRDAANRQFLGKTSEAITVPSTRWPGKALSFFGSAILFFITLFIVGLPLALLCVPLCSSIEAIPLAFFAGYSLLNLPVASLALVGVPTFTHSFAISLSIIGCSIVASLIIIAKSPRVLPTLARNLLSMEAFLVFSIALAATLFVFSPSSLKGEWFLGQALTDTFYYSNWSTIYSLIPPYQHIGEGLFSMRIADLSATKIASDLMGSDTLRAQGPHAAALWFAFSMCAWLIVSRFSTSLLLRVSGTCLLSINPTTYALFSESYTAQFIFIALLASATAAIGLFDRDSPHTADPVSLTSRPNLAITLLVAPLFAMAAAIYPYHFALPVACVFAALLAALRRSYLPLTRTLLVGFLSALLVNTQFLILLRFGETGQFMGKLNEIARHIVFPYFNSFTVLEVIVGVRDHFLYEHALGGIPLSKFTGVIPALDAVLTCTILSVSVFGLIYALISRNFFTTTLGIHVILLVGITSALFITDQPYAFGKMILSLGFPLVALAVFGVDRFAATCKPLTQYAASVLMIFWIARSGISIVMMNTPPMLPPQLAVMRSVRSHVDELPDDVQRIRPLLTSVKDVENQKVVVIGHPGSLKGTDGDRVIAFAIWHQLVGTTQHYFPGPLLGGNAHGGSYQVISDRLTLEKQLRDGDFDALIVMNDELELLPLSRYTLYHRGDRFSLFARAS